MATVKELREWLKRFPDDTEVEVLKQEPSSFYQEYGDVHFVELVLNDDSDFGENWDFTDFTNNKNVKPEDNVYKKKYLMLGSD